MSSLGKVKVVARIYGFLFLLACISFTHPGKLV